MSQRMDRRRMSRLVVAIAAMSALSSFGSQAAASPVLDEALQAITCSGLLDGAGGAVEGELAALLDPSYCHSQSATTACAPQGTTCTTQAEDETPDGSVQVDVTGVADPSGFMTLAVGKTAQTHACGEPLYLPVSIRFESQGVSDLVASHRISKALDHQTEQNGAENIGVCYQSPKAFTDADGVTTTYGLLPTCDATAGVAPCILERHKNKADAILKMKLPPGDPVWKMVEDFVDEHTG